jgi:hypothetical protein
LENYNSLKKPAIRAAAGGDKEVSKVTPLYIFAPAISGVFSLGSKITLIACDRRLS